MYFNFDKRIIYVIIAIMVVWGLSSYIGSEKEIINLLYSIPGVLIAITFHEYAHAKVADKLGDDTPRLEGRLSLNPLAHIDPVGFIILIFAGFGWGKPVNVNPRNYNRDISMDKADAIVSVAGPVTNFILAIIFLFVYFIFIKITGTLPPNTRTLAIGAALEYIISYIILINIGLGVFNLIPLPPLDGSKVIKPFLSYNAKQWFENNERIFYIVFIILWITGLAGIIISPIINGLYSVLMNFGRLIFGLML